MATANLNDCTQLDSTLLERVNYFPRQLLTADDMTADQDYFIAKLRRHNRYLHGYGVVCGLEISVAPTTQSPWQVQIGAGYALGPYGDEIYVPNPVFLDLAQCGPGASTDPCDPGSLLQGGISKTSAVLYLAIRYEECYSRPVRVMPGGCGCTDSSCEPSRISDSYEIQCLADLPPSGGPTQGPSLCDIINGQALSQCPPCPTDPWIVLAQIKLPGNQSTALAQTAVDNVTVRRMVFSTAMIQEQVRLCCCAGADKAPARVTSVTPAPGTTFTDATTIPPVLVVTFDKHLVAASVNTNTILVLRVTPGVPSKQSQGTVTYDDGSRTAQFSPAESFTIPGTYQLTVVGTGPNQITDSDNLALDGDADGRAGGNFVSQFVVATTAPTPTPTPSPTATPTPTPTSTQAPPKLVGTLKGPSPVPTIKNTNPSAVGDLLLSITGGAAGQKFQANVTITLSQNLATGTAADTAQWNDSTGATAAAVKGANSYTFAGVMIVPAGGTGSFDVKLTNMKIDASHAGAAGALTDITAIASIASATAVGLSAPTALVARVIFG